MEQKILSLKDDKIISEVELYEYPEELRGGRNLIPNSKEEWSMDSKDAVKRWYEIYLTKGILEKGYYTISFEAKSTVPTDEYYVSLAVGNSSKIYFVHRPSSERVTNQWVRYSFVANNILDTITNIIFCNSTQYASPTNTGVMTIRNIKLEKGTIATDWTPAPEDLNLSYPDFITEFKPSISDQYILTEELIEGGSTSFGDKITTNEFIEQ